MCDHEFIPMHKILPVVDNKDAVLYLSSSPSNLTPFAHPFPVRRGGDQEGSLILHHAPFQPSPFCLAEGRYPSFIPSPASE